MSLGEKVLFARHSPFNLIVLTEDEAGLRTLRFGHDGVRQSVVKPGQRAHLELPYTAVLARALDCFAPNPGRVLIVGLGGGTLAGYCHAHLPEALIDVVEIDPEVLEVAKTYCGFQEDARLRVHLADGRDFIESTSTLYDVVILDSFDAETIPGHLLTLEFLAAVRRSLAPGGRVLANIWGRACNRRYEDMLVTYQEAFTELYVFDVPEAGTKIFAALPAPLHESARRRLPAQGPGTGFRHADAERRRGGSVLRD